jgi:hypothetical protein
MNWFKITNKSGSVFRVEMVINDTDAFKVRRQVGRQEEPATRYVPMRKKVANMFRYRNLLMTTYSRHLLGLAVVDDPTLAT